MPREGGQLKTYMFEDDLFIIKPTNMTLISTHFGKTDMGCDYMDFLGEDDYNDHVIAPFDDFLHESFSVPRFSE